jgi:predicted metal-binding membrane protein
MNNYAAKRVGVRKSVSLARSPVLGSLVLISAGIYQWTPFKYACLRHCRAPLQFLLKYWRDGNVGAFLMGVRHGAYCLGCCWLLMTVLFAVGVMNLAWITALSVFVLLEKVIPRRIVGGQDCRRLANGLWRLFGTIGRSLSQACALCSLPWDIGLTFQCSGFICSVSQRIGPRVHSPDFR